MFEKTMQDFCLGGRVKHVKLPGKSYFAPQRFIIRNIRKGHVW